MTRIQTWRRPAALLVLVGASVAMVGFASTAGAWTGGEHERTPSSSWTSTPPSSGAPSSSAAPSSVVPSTVPPTTVAPTTTEVTTTTQVTTTTTEATTTTAAPTTTTPVGVSPEELVRPETGESPEVEQLGAEAPLAATGGDASLPLGVGLIVLGVGAVLLGIRRRNHEG